MKQIVKLAYNNAGNSILALASNGIHLVWLWPRTGFNLDGKVFSLFLSCDLFLFTIKFNILEIVFFITRQLFCRLVLRFALNCSNQRMASKLWSMTFQGSEVQTQFPVLHYQNRVDMSYQHLGAWSLCSIWCPIR